MNPVLTHQNAKSNSVHQARRFVWSLIYLKRKFVFEASLSESTAPNMEIQAAESLTLVRLWFMGTLAWSGLYPPSIWQQLEEISPMSK